MTRAPVRINRIGIAAPKQAIVHCRDKMHVKTWCHSPHPHLHLGHRTQPTLEWSKRQMQAGIASGGAQ